MTIGPTLLKVVPATMAVVVFDFSVGECVIPPALTASVVLLVVGVDVVLVRVCFSVVVVVVVIVVGTDNSYLSPRNFLAALALFICCMVEPSSNVMRHSRKWHRM